MRGQEGVRDAGVLKRFPRVRALVHHDIATGIPSSRWKPIAGCCPSAETHRIKNRLRGNLVCVLAVTEQDRFGSRVNQKLLVGTRGTRGQQDMAPERAL